MVNKVKIQSFQSGNWIERKEKRDKKLTEEINTNGAEEGWPAVVVLFGEVGFFVCFDFERK